MEEKQLDFNQPLLSVRRFENNSLPPKPPVFKSEFKSGPVRNPGSVPFVWEKSPGRPKFHNQIPPPVIPKLPPGRIERQTMDDAESCTEGLDEMDNISSAASDIYVDALDRLSRSESFYFNCSVNGVAGLDVLPSQSDPLAPNFMMDRFLPAAKAMASETPPHYTRKQSEQQPIKQPIKRHTFGQCNTNMPHCAPTEQIEDEEDDDNYSGQEQICGLFPRLYLQNSFCLLNPVPGMRKQAHLPTSSSHMRGATSPYRSCNPQLLNKDPAIKHLSSGSFETNMYKDESELKSESNKSSCRNDNKKLNGSSLYKRLQGNNAKFTQTVVDKDKRFHKSPEKSNNSGVTGFNANSKCVKIFRELLADEDKDWETASASPLVEKTLYVDSVHTLHSRGNSGNEEITSFDFSRNDMKHFDHVNEKSNILPEILKSANSGDSSLSNRSPNDEQKVFLDDDSLMGVSNKPGSTAADEDLKFDSERKLGQKSEGSNPIKTREADDGKIDNESQLCKKLSDQEAFDGCFSPLPLPPPLPKSPTESWLQRTLPAVSSKHASLKCFVNMNSSTKVQAFNEEPKWETIVKTSNMDNGHSRFSEELLTPIPEV